MQKYTPGFDTILAEVRINYLMIDIIIITQQRSYVSFDASLFVCLCVGTFCVGVGNDSKERTEINGRFEEFLFSLSFT